jgi:GT2 family glycosyltransferase
LVGSHPPDELFVVVNTNLPLSVELARSLPREVRLLHCRRPGLSEARNVGIAAASADVVAFVDDDATVDQDWLSAVVTAFEHDERILGVGGQVIPAWGADRRWMPDELLWVVGCTYSGHREDAGPIRNPVGCNMAFRRRELIAVGNFATTFGKRGTALATCDETELGLRVEQLHGPGRICYLPQARVQHFVPPTRISWRLLVRRSLSEGLAKGRLHRLYRRPALGVERRYARLLLTERVPRLIVESVRRRDSDPALGAAAILASLLISGVAFAVGLAREEPRPTQQGEDD